MPSQRFSIISNTPLLWTENRPGRHFKKSPGLFPCLKVFRKSQTFQLHPIQQGIQASQQWRPYSLRLPRQRLSSSLSSHRAIWDASAHINSLAENNCSLSKHAAFSPLLMDDVCWTSNAYGIFFQFLPLEARPLTRAQPCSCHFTTQRGAEYLSSAQCTWNGHNEHSVQRLHKAFVPQLSVWPHCTSLPPDCQDGCKKWNSLTRCCSTYSAWK